MSDASWSRLLARWSPRPPGGSETAATLAFELTDGAKLFEIRPADSHDAHDALADGWVSFGFRHGYPAAVAHAPDAPYLLVVHAVAAPADREDFRRWLAEEHGPRQVSIPGVRWLEAYEADDAEHSFLNLWGLDDPAIVDGDAWVRVRESPWWDRVAHVPAGADRGVYRRREDQQASGSGSADDVSPGWTGRGR